MEYNLRIINNHAKLIYIAVITCEFMIYTYLSIFYCLTASTCYKYFL